MGYMSGAETTGFIIGAIIGAVIFLGLLYLVIRYAVLHALRDHTLSSTTGVSIVSAVPLVLKHADAEVAEPSEQR